MSRTPYRIKAAFGISVVLVALVWFLWGCTAAFAKPPKFESIEQNAEEKIRALVLPILDKYCGDSCKLLNVTVDIGLNPADKYVPGFDEEIRSPSEPSPTSAEVKLLLDDKLGEILKGKIVDLTREYLNTLNYPVKIETQSVRFPLTKGSDQRANQIRNQIGLQFKETVEELLHRFCPKHCFLGDINVDTDVVSSEDAQYGNPGEFYQNGDVTLRLNGLSAAVVMDESLPLAERSNILEMTRLKTASLKHVTISGKTIKFPDNWAWSPSISWGSGSDALGANGKSLNIRPLNIKPQSSLFTRQNSPTT